MLWPDTSAHAYYTGGEDGCVCLWSGEAKSARTAVPRAKKHHGLGKRQRDVLL